MRTWNLSARSLCASTLLALLALCGCASPNVSESGGRTTDGSPMPVQPPTPSLPAGPSAPSDPSMPAPTGPDPSTGCTSGDACTPTTPAMPGAGAGGATAMAGSTAPEPVVPTPGDLDPGAETCFDFRNHGSPTTGDTSKYGVIPGEHYLCNHFTVPWKQAAELVRWETLYDNKPLLHHWLVYSVPGGAVDGQFEPCIGTHVLQDAQLVAGWAVGSNDVTLPEDIGLRMPGPDRSFLIEWHFYNTSGAVQMDGSGVRLCVLPAGVRANTAGITWLGTENFNGPAGMPAGQKSQFGGTCINDSAAPIRIFRFWPHMHQWGRRMVSTVARAGGSAAEGVFDMAFDFNYQISYEADVVLQPGDSITSVCHFDNQSLAPVAFGPSSDQEMCYQFAFSYPAGALDNGVLSLVGATNTCW